MKKISIIAIVILSILITPYPAARATSGTCSYHNGVNCDAGADWDGSTICNDGWRDSSERYSDMVMCQETTCYNQMLTTCEGANFDYLSYYKEKITSNKDYKGNLYEGVEQCLEENPIYLEVYGTYTNAASICLDIVKEDHEKAEWGACENTKLLCSERKTEQLWLDLMYTNDAEDLAIIFVDVNENTAYFNSIRSLKEKGIIAGYPDGTFKPHNAINRAEFLKIAIGSKYSSIDDSYNQSCFKDVAKNQWYTKYVCFAKKNAIINGYPDGTFRPTQNINYAEALKITLEIFGYSPQPSDPWYSSYIEEAKKIGVHLNLNVSTILERGAMAELIERLMN